MTGPSDNLKFNKAFCVLPWIHLHVMPDSSVLPCCVSPYDDHYGNVSQESVENIWNNSKYKELRMKMLAGELPSGCKHCHDLEASGFGSMRTTLNARFKDDIPQILMNTSADGSFHELKLKYIDIRFSNLCNFKCRGCGPTLSSSWYEDHNQLYNHVFDKKKVRSVAADSPEFWKKFNELVMDAEEIYFGGGEPLITKEHFDLLRLLIAKNKTNIRLSYNTNLSTLTYGNHNLVELWSKFKSVSLGVSLDDMGARAEYFRNGTKWEVVEANLKNLRDNYPGVFRYINCTVNIMNVYYLPELYSYLTNNKFIGMDHFNINLLLDPSELRIDVLPPNAKLKVKTKLEKFIHLLLGSGNNKAAHDFKNIINMMMEKAGPETIEVFFEKTRKLDAIRNESFEKTYPELMKILESE